MKEFKTKIKVVLVLFIITMLYACNTFSSKNISNDFRWKKQKFSETIEINFEYMPEITIKIPKRDLPWFYNRKDSLDADKNYKIQELLIKKFKKRNISLSKKSNSIRLYIEKLAFEEYAESISVDENDGGHLGYSEIDYFVFEISGKLIINDTVIRTITSENKHQTQPRESYVIPGLIVKDGANAKPEKMIENTINTFSYVVYKELNDLKSDKK